MTVGRSLRTGREKAAGRDTVGFFLRLPARPPVPSRLREACNSMVNETLTEADGHGPAGQGPEPKSSRTQRANFVASLGFLPKVCCVERLYYEVRPSELDDACDR